MLARLRINSAGDTIIEVLVVLAVLGLGLGISYATANRSLQSTNSAQENAQATALLQSQTEALRYLASTQIWAPGQNIFTQSGLFCVDTGATPMTVDNSFGGSNTNQIASPDIYPAACEQTAPFHVAISQAQIDSSTAGTASDFTLKATWPDSHGNGLDTVTLDYRLYNND